MPSLQFLNMFGRQLTQLSIATSVPLGFLLVGLQAIMEVKFSCPCIAGWNIAISALIFCAPALFAFSIMFALLRPFQYKHSCCQKNNNSETSKRKKDCKEKPVGLDNKETSQGKNEETPQGKNEETPQEHLKHCKQCRVKTFLVCWIPSLLWICIFFIDGDYIACGFTTCNGRYACDKELHPYCLNWCKPTELSPEKNETECYESTRKWIYISKITGYILVLIFCIIAIILVTFDWDGCLPKCSNTENSTPPEPKPDKSSIESLTEENKSFISRQRGRGDAEEEEEEEQSRE